MSERLVAVLMMLAIFGFVAWRGWRPGGPMNRHVWMSEQIKPAIPTPPLKPLPPTKAGKPGSAAWGLNVQEYDINLPLATNFVPLEIQMRSGDQLIFVKLDVCMKHGEWRVLP